MRRLKILAAMAALAAAVIGCHRLGEYLYRNFTSKDVSLTAGPARKAFTVILDAGHGGFDSGKIGVNGAKEKNINLAVAKLLEEELKNRGVKVLMTRESENALADTKAEDMKKRVDIINVSRADLAVSIHQNSYTAEEIRGAQVFYYTHSKAGELAANTVQKALLAVDKKNTRMAKANDSYYILKKTAMPVIIVECGFLSNYEEAEKLVTLDYQKEVASSVADGIMEYFEKNDRR